MSLYTSVDRTSHGESLYFDQKFMEPQVNQYGSHMVMTNVIKSSKKKYINLDTKYRDDVSTSSSIMDVHFTLPDRITDVKSMIVCNVELPMTFNIISSSLDNNYFLFKFDEGGANPIHINAMFTLSNREHTANTIIQEINLFLGNYPSLSGVVSCTYDSVSKRFTFTTNGTGILYIGFAVTSTGAYDPLNLKNKLGWILGFREPYISIQNKNTISTYPISLYGPQYLYLVMEEYTKSVNNTFIVPKNTSLLRKNIIAKIVINRSTYTTGSVLTANVFNGLLLTDRRTYSGKIDLQKMNVQLVNDAGQPVDLNGNDMSFCLEVEHE